MKLDEMDMKILNILQQNGKIKNTKLASLIGVSPPAMLERVKRLESSGVIKKYAALVDRAKIDMRIMAFISISLSVHQLTSLDEFTHRILEMEEVLECYQVSGSHDFVLKVVLPSMDYYSDLINKKITRIPGVRNTESTFVLSTIKDDTAFPLPML